jgi:hemoglobin
MNKYDTLSIDNIREMVRDFYAKILEDEILAPIFIKSLGDDINSGKWPSHLRTIDKFWGLMMGGNTNYIADPFPAHAFLGALTPKDFGRWLKLFHEVVYRLFVPKIANKFYKHANILAEIFMNNLGLYDEDE